jgi:hypothetical protein
MRFRIARHTGYITSWGVSDVKEIAVRHSTNACTRTKT